MPVAGLRDRIDDPQGTEGWLVSPDEDGIRIYPAHSYTGQILQEMGLARPPAQREFAPEATFVWTGASKERLDAAALDGGRSSPKVSARDRSEGALVFRQ